MLNIEVLSLLASMVAVYYARKQYHIENDRKEKIDSEFDDISKIILEDSGGLINLLNSFEKNKIKNIFRYRSILNAIKQKNININNKDQARSVIIAIMMHEIKASISRTDPMSSNSMKSRINSIYDRNQVSEFIVELESVLDDLVNPTYASIGKKPDRIDGFYKIHIPPTYLCELAIFYLLKKLDLIDCEIHIDAPSTVETINFLDSDVDLVVGADASIDPIISQSGLAFKPFATFGTLTNRLLMPVNSSKNEDKSRRS